MLEGLSLGSYLLLVDYTGRLFRAGKAVISAELANIFDRLGTTADSWWSRLEKLSQGRLLGRYFAAKRERLREVARDLGVHHLANLADARRDKRPPVGSLPPSLTAITRWESLSSVPSRTRQHRAQRTPLPRAATLSRTAKTFRGTSQLARDSTACATSSQSTSRPAAASRTASRGATTTYGMTPRSTRPRSRPAATMTTYQSSGAPTAAVSAGRVATAGRGSVSVSA